MGDFIQKIAVPVITALTALMVTYLNYKVANNDQELKEKISELDLLIKKSGEERADRVSNQNFNLKIYDIVRKSLEEKNPQKQEAAKAFIIVMVDEPLRSSFLNVLKQGGDSNVKNTIGQILKKEEKFRKHDAIIPEKKASITPSYNWGEWDFDIFWCTASKDPAKDMARQVGEQLIAEGARGRVRIRELPESINARPGYQIDGYSIRQNSNEQKTAEAPKNLSEKVISKTDKKITFNLEPTSQDTPWYISAFICPTS